VSRQRLPAPARIASAAADAPSRESESTPAVARLPVSSESAVAAGLDTGVLRTIECEVYTTHKVEVFNGGMAGMIC